MKRASLLIPAVVLGIMAVIALGQIIPTDPDSYPSVSIVNTPHNLNNYPGVNIPGNQVCLPCHTPHNALLSGAENVLWNHAETGQTFAMFITTEPQSAKPEGPSKLCLSCHDGVTAIDNYGGSGGTGIVITGKAAIGTDLSNDHPIGVVYPTARPSEYKDPSTFAPGIGSGPGVKLVTISGRDRVECNSCHNVHNNGLGNFLRAPIQESWLCLQCHIK
jgi:predicted CXXCH cytochrome family protein